MTEKYSGLAITPKELQKFMIDEQASPGSNWNSCLNSKLPGLQSFSRGVLGDHQGLRDEGHAGAEQGYQPLHGQAGFSQVRKIDQEKVGKYSSLPRFVMSSSLFLITNRVMAENVYQVT